MLKVILNARYGWKWEILDIENQVYYANYLKLNSYDARMLPLYFLYGGYASNGSLYSAGTFGGYWSSAIRSPEVAYNLDFNSVGIYSSLGNARFLGLSIRCLAR